MKGQEFQGETYKSDKYQKLITCRAPNLESIKNDQTLYVCDGKGDLVATIKVLRFYTTVIEARLINGNPSAIRPQMPVYTRSQYEQRHSKEYPYYLWDVDILYRLSNPATNIVFSTTLVLPKNIELTTPEKIKKQFPLDENIQEIVLKDSCLKNLRFKDNSDILVSESMPASDFFSVPDRKIETGTRLIRKFIYLNSTNASRIKLVYRRSGADPPKKKKKRTIFTAAHLSATNIGGISFVFLAPGEFVMGSQSGEGNDRERPQHTVKLSGFWIGKHEVTQAQWNSIMGNNPSKFSGTNLPVEQVSWNDTQEFCVKFKEKFGITIRLPTEAEWEYACRAGTVSRFYWGDKFSDKLCWHSKNSGNKTRPIGQKAPNPWGLYDMTGNIWEWCQDWYSTGFYSTSPLEDPECEDPASGWRVLRGGAWYNLENLLRSAARYSEKPDVRNYGIGFRLVRTE